MWYDLASFLKHFFPFTKRSLHKQGLVSKEILGFKKLPNFATAKHCNMLQRTAAHGNTLQHAATHCTSLQLVATYILQRVTHCLD